MFPINQNYLLCFQFMWFFISLDTRILPECQINVWKYHFIRPWPGLLNIDLYLKFKRIFIVPSNYLLRWNEKAWSVLIYHISCICFTLSYCVFSNVFSNYLPERMHNHIYCICLTFLHCTFLNVSSNRMRIQREAFAYRARSLQ